MPPTLSATRARAALLVSLVSLVALTGCEDGEIALLPPARLGPRPAHAAHESGCAALVSPQTSWQQAELALAGDAPLAITDPAVLGGPFASPLRASMPGPLSLRLLTNAAGVQCVELRRPGAEARTHKALGGVAVDSDMLLIGREPALLAQLRPQLAPTVACVEGQADSVDRAIALLKPAGLDLDHEMPTLACSRREASTDDLALLHRTLRDHKLGGRALVEPRPAAWQALTTLGTRSWAPLTGGEGTRAEALAGVVVEVRSGDGVYPVRAGLDERGEVATIEIALK